MPGPIEPDGKKILNAFKYELTNGPTEGFNIKKALCFIYAQGLFGN